MAMSSGCRARRRPGGDSIRRAGQGRRRSCQAGPGEAARRCSEATDPEHGGERIWCGSGTGGRSCERSRTGSVEATGSGEERRRGELWWRAALRSAPEDGGASPGRRTMEETGAAAPDLEEEGAAAAPKWEREGSGRPGGAARWEMAAEVASGGGGGRRKRGSRIWGRWSGGRWWPRYGGAREEAGRGWRHQGRRRSRGGRREKLGRRAAGRSRRHG